MMVNNVIVMLPANWKIQIIFKNNRMAMQALKYYGIQRQIQLNKIILTQIPDNMTKIKKRDLMLSGWFWNSIASEKGSFLTYFILTFSFGYFYV